MMNAKRSAVYKLTRYSFVAPAVLILLLAFGTSKAALIKKSISAVKHATSRVMNIAVEVQSNSKNKPVRQMPDTTLKAAPKVVIKDVKPTGDTSKIKTVIKVHFKGPDSSYYVLNGTLVSAQKITEINPKDIENISIVGRPSASSLFGSKAENGAVLIVTKGQANTTINKQLLQKISELKSKGGTEKTGIISIHPPVGSLNSVTIVGTGDSVIRGNAVITSITTTNTSDNVSDSSRNRLKEFTVSGRPYSLRFNYTDGKTDPLYILNDKAVTTEQMKNLDPNTFESVTILKENTATALYGYKAKYGVVIITTKAGKKK